MSHIEATDLNAQLHKLYTSKITDYEKTHGGNAATVLSAFLDAHMFVHSFGGVLEDAKSSDEFEERFRPFLEGYMNKTIATLCFILDVDKEQSATLQKDSEAIYRAILELMSKEPEPANNVIQLH